MPIDVRLFVLIAALVLMTQPALAGDSEKSGDITFVTPGPTIATPPMEIVRAAIVTDKISLLTLSVSTVCEAVFHHRNVDHRTHDIER